MGGKLSQVCLPTIREYIAGAGQMVFRGKRNAAFLLRWSREQLHFVENRVRNAVPNEKGHKTCRMFFCIMVDWNRCLCSEIGGSNLRRWRCQSTKHTVCSDSIIKGNWRRGDPVGRRCCKFRLNKLKFSFVLARSRRLDIGIHAIVAWIRRAFPTQRDGAVFLVYLCRNVELTQMQEIGFLKKKNASDNDKKNEACKKQILLHRFTQR